MPLYPPAGGESGDGGAAAVAGHVTDFHADVTDAFTSGSLALDAGESGTLTINGSGFEISRIQVSRICRLRLYVSTAARDADIARAEDEVPEGDHGLVLDYVFTVTGTPIDMPGDILGHIAGGGTALPYRLTNKGSTGTNTVTLTYRRTK